MIVVHSGNVLGSASSEEESAAPGAWSVGLILQRDGLILHALS